MASCQFTTKKDLIDFFFISRNKILNVMSMFLVRKSADGSTSKRIHFLHKLNNHVIGNKMSKLIYVVNQN